MSIACAACDPELTYPWATFFLDLNELMIYTTPAALCVVLWKIFVTNRRGPRANVLGLGLDDSAPVYSELPEPAVSNWIVVLYVLTGVATFTLGVLVFAVVHALS